MTFIFMKSEVIFIHPLKVDTQAKRVKAKPQRRKGGISGCLAMPPRKDQGMELAA